MALIDDFLKQHVSEPEFSLYNNPHGPDTGQHGKVLVLDFPIKEFDLYLAKCACYIRNGGYKKFGLIVANEGGALLGSLLGAGYTVEELLKMRVEEGKLDIVKLIEGKKKAPKVLHKKNKGGQHKGLRLQKEVGELLQSKLGLDHSPTFTDFVEKNCSPVIFTCFDDAHMKVAFLSGHEDNSPMMEVAEGVLSSCAVQPYIRRVKFFDSEGGKHNFYSCSPIQTLPILDAQAIYKKRRALLTNAPHFETSVIGYGFGDDLRGDQEPPEEGEYLKLLSFDRPKTIVPDEFRKRVKLFKIPVD